MSKPKKDKGNTRSYRKAKRVTAFVRPEVKKIILEHAERSDRSVSDIVHWALCGFFGVK